MRTSEGTCGCGCGKRTNLDTCGRPRRFLQGHNQRGTGKGWLEQGYRFVKHQGRRKALHRVIVEEREGRELSRNEIVHHVDHNPLNNDPSNLVILNRAEHARLHSGGKRRRWTEEERVRAAELYESGMNIQEVARALGRPYYSTRCSLVKSGCNRSPSQTKAARKQGG